MTNCKSRSRKRSSSLNEARPDRGRLDLFAEQDPRILGRDDERLARDPWRLFAADNSKAGFDCSEPRLGRWRRPVPQQHFSRVGGRQNNPVAIDPTGLNDNWLSETSRTHDTLQSEDMLAVSDRFRHLKCTGARLEHVVNTDSGHEIHKDQSRLDPRNGRRRARRQDKPAALTNFRQVRYFAF